MRVMPATQMTSGQARVLSQLACSADAMTSTTTSTEARPAARAMPRRSVSALPAMLPSAPAAGISSQATTYAAAPNRLNRAATTKAIRTTVTSRPVRAASPAATPPASRSSRLRRSGPGPGELRIQV